MAVNSERMSDSTYVNVIKDMCELQDNYLSVDQQYLIGMF
jgi:hypothetical protein